MLRYHKPTRGTVYDQKDLLNWQYQSYSTKHQDKMNIKIHLLTVPLVWLGFLSIAYAVFTAKYLLLIAGVKFFSS